MPPRRTPLRERHHNVTRDSIVDALVRLLVEHGELSYPELSRRSGVSIRTIYRHFPTRDDLYDELSRRVNVVMGLRDYPRTREGVVALVRSLFSTFDRNAELVVAQTRVAGRLRTKARQKRGALVHDVFSAAMPNLPVERRKAAAGLVAVLLSANTWARLREEHDLDGAQSGDITAWAIDTLWRALEK